MAAAVTPEPSSNRVAGSGVATVKPRLDELLTKNPSPLKVSVNSGLLLKASSSVRKAVNCPIRSELLKLREPVKYCDVRSLNVNEPNPWVMLWKPNEVTNGPAYSELT